MAKRYLIIDAYNVICATDHLRKALRKNLDAARDQLAEGVRAIHDAEGVHVALILDSQNERLQSEYPYRVRTFEYLYAPSSLAADGVIERIIARARKPADVTVVTNDNLVRTATRVGGAMAIGPEELFEWARACEGRLRRDARERNAKNARDFKNTIDIPVEPRRPKT